jgi:hypothetical protein
VSYSVDKIFLEPYLFSGSIIRLVQMKIDLLLWYIFKEIEIRYDRISYFLSGNDGLR